MFQSTLPTRGSDALGLQIHRRLAVSIHAPHEGERPKPCAGRRCASAFQSTLPTRGSDTICRAISASWARVSIHAPHEGERLSSALNSPTQNNTFQSTLPTRGSDDVGIYARK